MAVRLEPPDGHVVVYAKIPCCVDGAVGVVLVDGAEVSAGQKVHDVVFVYGAFEDGV